MTTTPPITVGLPVFNAGPLLDEALESLCAQTFADFEVLVSDNASQDDTADRLARWRARDARLRIVRQPRNLGMVENFAWVRRNARAPLFMQAAHDDTWSPGYIESLLNAFTATPGTLLAVPTVTKTHPDGTPELTTPPPNLDTVTGAPRIRCLMRRAQSGWIYGLFDRETLIAAEAPTRRFGHIWGNEFITLLPFLYSGRIVDAPDAVYFQRQTGLSEEHYKPKSRAEQWALYRAFLTEGARLMNEAPLTPLQRITLGPALLRYTDNNAWRLRRLIRAAVGFS